MSSELQVYRDPKEGPCWREFYEKSAVDAVIAEKDRALEFAKALTLKDIKTIEEKDKEIAELKAQIESEKASRHAEGVAAGIRERKLKRALWLMGARLCKMGSLAFHNIKAKLYFLDDADGVRRALRKREQWEEVERRCRAKAEDYK